ncbi:hypothetical protein ACF0H5_017943 [Mactra antiquata]
MLLAQESVYIFIVSIMIVVQALAGREVVTVNSEVGTINGYVKETTFLGKTSKIDRFQGIPYAESPVGERRFLKASPKARFNEPLNAFSHSSMCMQTSLVKFIFPYSEYQFSEDCLYLNIYAPHSRNKEENLPVMIWLYGGGFNFGFSDLYLGDNIAAFGNVIVVTFNYRLSVWGFLKTGNDIAPGNAGLWDQHLAIKWVHDNIQAFGGNNNKITLFGESAGSSSVIYQALYPGNKGLFQRVIGQSGSVESYWANQGNVPKFTEVLSSETGCNSDDAQTMFTCLQAVSNNQLIELLSNVSYGFVDFPFPFNPTRDDDFIRYDPTNSAFVDLSTDVIEMFQSVDVLTGVTSAEGSIGLSPLLGVPDAENFRPSKAEYENVVAPNFLKFVYRNETNIDLLNDIAVAEYTNWVDPYDYGNIRQEYVNMNGDAAFLAPLYNTINKHVQVSTFSNTYMYVFDAVPDTKLVPQASWLKGMAHFEDVLFVFGYKTEDHEADSYGKEWEKMVSKDVITLWTNFAKTGNPNKPVSLGLDWLPYTEKHQHYLHITRDMTSLNVKQRWNTRRANFWSQIVPKVRNKICLKPVKISSNEEMRSCEKDGGCSP